MFVIFADKSSDTIISNCLSLIAQTSWLYFFFTLYLVGRHYFHYRYEVVGNDK